MIQFPRPQKLLATVTKKEYLVPNIYRFVFDIGEAIDFVPGQSFSLVLDKGIRRSYSISSQPGTNLVETYVDIRPGGPASKFYEAAEVGTQIEMILPLGRFIYTEKETPLYFVATGTGITPILSMVNHALASIKSDRPITLLFGLKDRNAIYLENEFTALAAKYSNFNFKICLSQEENEKYYKGRVTKYILDQELDIKGDAYICGSQNMIDDVKSLLISKGFDEATIYSEQFY